LLGRIHITELSSGTYCATVTVNDPECNDNTGSSCKAVKCFNVRERECDCEGDDPGIPSIRQRQICYWVYPEGVEPYVVRIVQVIVDISSRAYCINMSGLNPSTSVYNSNTEQIHYTFDENGILCYSIIDKCTLEEYTDCITIEIDTERPCFTVPPQEPSGPSDRIVSDKPDVISVDQIEPYTDKIQFLFEKDRSNIELSARLNAAKTENNLSEKIPDIKEYFSGNNIEINAFPNPFNDLLTVEILLEKGEPQNIQLSLSSIDGKKLFTQSNVLQLGENTYKLPVAIGLRPGLYYLSIMSNDKIQTIPIVKI